MYKYYNAHPRGLIVDDCVKRAITVTARMDYGEVSRELNRYKKVTGASSFNSDYNPHRYVERVLKAEKIGFPMTKGSKRITAEQFGELYSRGRYILTMAGHWTACVDGVIFDTWDCSKNYIYSAYEIKTAKSFERSDPVLRFCYTVHRISSGEYEVTFYDGNGKFVTQTLNDAAAKQYIDHLSARGFYDMTDMEELL